MNEIDIKKKVVMTIIENCTMEFDNTGRERYSLNESQFGKVVDTLVENLSLSGVVKSFVCDNCNGKEERKLTYSTSQCVVCDHLQSN
jgi:hypothetical protein